MNAPLPEHIRKALETVTLDDKYSLDYGRAFMSGVQALVKLPMLQRLRDAQAGKNTAGFISGYRGSPLGGYDQALWKADKFLKAQNIVFQPGVNEELAATALWGTQQLGFAPAGTRKFDGVFGIWYGKGPGVDRSGDVFKHANMAGTTPWGGVIAVAGDDHVAKSSTAAHQSDHIFKACGLPVFFPANVQEILDLGLHAFAMSRYSGVWAGMKTIQEIVESSSTAIIDPDRVQIQLPTDFQMPPGGLHIRWPDAALDQEARLFDYKWYAALAYIRANRLNHNVIEGPNDRFGIIASGKAYNDTRQALLDLGLDDATCRRLGIRLHKVAVVWPLEAQTTREFAQGLREILVVEEKRQVIEYQVKEELYNWRADVRPNVLGKFDEQEGDASGGEWSQPNPSSNWLLRAQADLTPTLIAQAIAKRLKKLGMPEHIVARMDARLAVLAAKDRAMTAGTGSNAERQPWFCSGCPHNTSTKVPEGSRAMAGIGCHFMATWMDRETIGFTQMGGEGTPWVGQAPFSKRPHMFANLGDGTYYHSGSLAVRQSIAAGVNVTYKILYNDAVAMTGGQPVDGTLSVPQIAQQMRAEGVQTIAVVSDDIEKWSDHSIFPAGVSFHDRRELDAVQKTLREVKGTSILIYDQTCATEKRRRRKRGKIVDPQKRVMVNSLVCEGCGDCGVKSFCVSVLPKETEFGRKRDIDQSNCNKDYSCVEGFCPSFVTVHGGKLKKGKAPDNSGANTAARLGDLPMPTFASALDKPWNILITGVGGTGVVTIGALLGMAGHLEGKGATVLDQTGLAQKGGAVTTHIRIAKSPDDIHAVRIAAGEADLVLGCDMVVVNDYWALSKIREGRSNVVLNSYEAMPGTFTTRPDMQFPAADIVSAVRTALGGNDSPESALQLVDATQLANALMGDAIAANLFMLGYAWQQGLVPISFDAIMRAVELNGAAIEMNKTAFAWGRLAVIDLPAVVAAAGVVRNAPTAAESTPNALRLLAPSASEGHESGIAQQNGELRSADELRHVPADASDRDWFMPLDDARLSRSLDEVVARRIAFLSDYQNIDYAKRYSDFIAKVRTAEQAKAPGSSDLSEAVARYAFKLMAYKDEYEVARLYTSGDFQKRVAQQFEGDYKIRFHLAPPLLAKKDAEGRLIKQEFGPWVFTAFKLMAKLRFLRGGALDIFGRTEERRMERKLIEDYFATVEGLLGKLDAGNVALAAEIASIPEHIRGYGHVKEAHLHKAKTREAELLTRWSAGPASAAKAA